MVAIHETSYSIPDAPRIALIADLHNTGYKAVVDSINRRIPEIICIVGDIVRGQKTEDDKSLVEIQENVVPLLKGCAETAPTFMSLGNHEQHFDEQDAALVASTGVTLLDNAFTEIIVDRKKMVIGGLTSATCTDYRRAVAALSSEQRGKSRYPACDVSSIQKELPETEWL